MTKILEDWVGLHLPLEDSVFFPPRPNCVCMHEYADSAEAEPRWCQPAEAEPE